MHVRTRIPATSDGGLAWWVKCQLEGSALGCAPMFGSWNLPALYRSGVRFDYEPNHGDGHEEFATPPDVYARKWGDCDDLVVYRLAELYFGWLQAQKFFSSTERRQRLLLDRLALMVASDRLPSVHTKWRQEHLHVLIRLPGGGEEDPSILLGAPTQ